jgi:hypothetical protein
MLYPKGEDVPKQLIHRHSAAFNSSCVEQVSNREDSNAAHPYLEIAAAIALVRFFSFWVDAFR